MRVSSRIARVTAVLLFFSVAACAGLGPAHTHIDQETTADLLVSDGARRIHVFCIAEGTVMEVDASRFFFPGHRGITGDLGTSAGRVRIGDLRISYDLQELEYTGEFGGGVCALSSEPRMIIEQSGASNLMLPEVAR